MKYRKILYIVLTIALIGINFSIPSSTATEAKTLRTLKSELASMQAEYETSQNAKKYTEGQISTKKNNISAINSEIDYIQKEMVSLSSEIETLKEDIEKKEKEIKEIMNYYQISNGESAYLEYIFSATDFTDFIYRMAIAEQLSGYNDKLVSEYKNMIEQNKSKRKELESKTVSLNNKQASLQNELKDLGNQLSEVVEENVSIKEEIDSLKKLINTYENVYKCSLDEDLSTCGRSKLPPGTRFYRPTARGRVSADFGWYYPWGKAIWHYGMDISQTGHGANVYPVSDGKVVAVYPRTSCGGNQLFIQHIVNGTKYTSMYAHLAYVNVRVGDTVTTNSVVGGVGGNPSIETWDGCSTGTHLHLQIAYGWYLNEYNYSGFTSRSFNPRVVINFPRVGSYFQDRTTRY